MKFRKPSFVAATAIMLCAGTASAAGPVYTGTYVDMYLKQNTFPSGLNEQMVYLDAAVASTVTGHVGSQNGTQLVKFSSTTDTLDSANGFANIKAVDGYINNITITAPGYWFEDLIFSVNLKTNKNDDLVITATDKLGGTDSFTSWTSQTSWVSGLNEILVLATDGNLMQSVTINSQEGIVTLVGGCVELTCGIDQVKHIQISGVTAVPEAETYAMMLAGLGLVGWMGARRKSLAA